MNAKEYATLFNDLASLYGVIPENLVFADNIPEWCARKDIPEPDVEKPFKFLNRTAQMLIRENIPDRIIEERITAMHLRGQVENVAFDRADKLDSDEKKLAFLFLQEYALSLTELGEDELLADKWAYEEMEKLGYFKK